MARKKQPEQRKRRTDQIVTASAQLIREKGFHNATLDDVAKKLDVTKAALYYYVEDKEDLLFRIFRETLELAIVSVGAIVRSKKSPADKVRAIIDNQVRMISNSPAFFTVYFSEKGRLSAEHAKVVTKLERQIVRNATSVMRDGMTAGVFKRLNPTVAAFTVLGASSWVYRWYRPGGRLTVEDVSGIMQAVILSGLERGKP